MPRFRRRKKPMSKILDRESSWSAATAVPGRPSRGNQEASRIRRGTMVLLCAICLAGAGLIYSWSEATSKRIAADLHERLGGAILEAALPSNHFLSGYESFLGAARETTRAEFSALAKVRERALLGRRDPTYQLLLLNREGARTAQWSATGLPLYGDVQALIAEVEREQLPVISPAYRVGENWYATVMAIGPDPARPSSAGKGRRYLALTFPLGRLSQWWQLSGLPEGSRLAILTADRRLWWSYPLDPERLDRDMTRDPLFGALDSGGSGYGLAEVAPLDSERHHIVGQRSLDAFGLQIVAFIPSAQIGQLWRARHLGSLMIFLAAGFVIVGSILFTGHKIAAEAVKRHQAMAALEASEVRFRDMADAASDWFWRADPDGQILALSGRIEQVAGMRPESYIGKHRGSLFDARIEPGQLAAYQAAVEAREPFRDFVYPHTDPDGREHWIKISGKPIFDHDGAFQGYRGVGTDITEQRATEERLAALTARLERAIENSPYPFALFDDEGRLAVMNQGFVEHFQTHHDRPLEFGVRYEEVMRDYARSGRNLAAARDPAAWLVARRQIHDSGRAVDEPLSDGRWIRSRESRTPEGELICVYMDLTKEKRREAELLRLDEENRRLAAAIEATGVGIVITNPSLPENQVIFVNPAFTRITGYKPDDVIGRNCRLLQGPDTDPRDIAQMSEGLARGEAVELEILNYRKDGQPFWNLIAINPVFDGSGEVIYFVGILNDVTEQKQSEHELLITKEAAESANRSKSEFLAIMSHELRTPLNAIIGFSDILKAEMFGPVGDQRYKDYANDIFESGSHLLSLINDILDLSKAEAGKLELRESRFDIIETVERTLGMMRPHANTAAISLDLKADSGTDCLEVLADERKIKQVLLNLLSNALKFSTRDSRVTVSVTRVDEGVAIEVVDEGIGIPQEEIQRALEPFHQVDSTLSREREGTGLGLPLAKRMVELHGGCLTLESTPDVGTSVRFVLPSERVQREAA